MKHSIDRSCMHRVLLGALFLTVLALAPRAEAVAPCCGITAINAQNTVNPAGLVGGPPTPKGQEFTYAITAQSRLVTESEFRDIVLRENSDGSIVRLGDVARVELAEQPGRRASDVLARAE